MTHILSIRTDDSIFIFSCFSIISQQIRKKDQELAALKDFILHG